MNDLIQIIDNIIPFGLQANLSLPDRNILLESNLIRLYGLYYNISYEFDDKDYPEFDRVNLPNIRKNVETNFTDFGFYKTVLDCNDIDNLEKCGIGDAIDDITDIVYDLLEIRWRIANNSLADGIWFFQLIFKSHTQQHILDLLNYMKQNTG